MDKINDTMTFPSIGADTANDTVVIDIPERIKRRRHFKREARHIIFRGGNWYKLTFASIFMMLTAVSIKYICGSFFGIVNISANPIAGYAVSYLTDIVYLTVIVPLIFGFYSYCNRLSDDTPSRFGEIFDVFGSVSLLIKSYKVFYSYLWRYFVYFAVIYTALQTISNYHLSNLIFAVSLTVTAVFTIFGAIFLQRYYLTPYVLLRNENSTVHECVKLSARLMKGYKIDVLMFQFGFIIWLIVSYLTLGLTAILFTIPYYILANLEFSKFIFGEDTK